jgi:hypothetical protein
LLINKIRKAERGFENLFGVDYSAAAVALAKDIASKKVYSMLRIYIE